MRCKLTILAQSSKASSRSQDLSVRVLSSLGVEALSGLVGNTKIATKNIYTNLFPDMGLQSILSSRCGFFFGV